ncbi:MAG TPA: Hsp20/alpha crystallin family protein [Edaphobacter sp.]|nr:Hsp20/alpha crystallin family protein [Edaphobacter sp.]
MNEAKGNLVVTAELPGIEKEDVKIELIDQTLTIQSERNMEKKEEKEGFYQLRTQFRAVLSSILLPESAMRRHVSPGEKRCAQDFAHTIQPKFRA